jgi:flagellar assembly protein FliH
MTIQPVIDSRPFAFDTEFDGAGTVVRASTFRPTKRAYMPSEVEALVAQARFEAREAALAEVESIQAMAIAAIGQALAGSVPALTQVAQTHREQSADLALAAARVIAGGALERLPTGPLQAALEALGQEIDATPRLVVRAAGLDDGARARIQAVCVDAGFSGVVAFRDDPALPIAAFQLEWADGRADYDPAAAAERIGAALNSALATEAGHAESLNTGSDH